MRGEKLAAPPPRLKQERGEQVSAKAALTPLYGVSGHEDALNGRKHSGSLGLSRRRRASWSGFALAHRMGTRGD